MYTKEPHTALHRIRNHISLFLMCDLHSFISYLHPFWMRWGGREDVEVHVEGKARKGARFKIRLWL